MRSPLTILFLFTLCLIAFVHTPFFVSAADVNQDGTQPARTNISIEVRTTFPDSTTNTVGMFYNGRTSRVDVAISNKEAKPIMVQFIGGAFQDIATLSPIHNFTTKAYNAAIPPGSQQVVPYSIQAYFPGPRILHLSLDGQMYQSVAHNGTVTIADPPQSIFDPQAWFLYIILASAVAGAGYFVYATWIKTVMPKKPRARRDIKKREPADLGVSTGNYEEWIPQHHLTKRETAPSRKRKGGRPSTPASGSS